MKSQSNIKDVLAFIKEGGVFGYSHPKINTGMREVLVEGQG